MRSLFIGDCMPIFINEGESLVEANVYSFAKETELQELLYTFPKIILSIPELELEDEEIAVKFREYSTSRGPIDVLYVTRNANIIVVETKLIRNPESIRTVAAQLIDYIKALTIDGCENIQNKSCQCMQIQDNFSFDDKFIHLLNRNFSTGNICGIIAGDDVHPNLLGLIDSIQSAPHLAFHISLVKIETYRNNNQLLISAKTVESTKEVERSVIKITFESTAGKPIIESETPSKDGKGSKPILIWEEYINNVDAKYQETIEKYRQEWIKCFGETISMGTVGFTAGIIAGEKRLAPLWVYDNKIRLITEKNRLKMGIPDDIYSIYKNELKKSPEVYDKLISGKSEVLFNDINIESLETIFDAAIKCAQAIRNK
jgi:hypothetical protein